MLKQVLLVQMEVDGSCSSEQMAEIQSMAVMLAHGMWDDEEDSSKHTSTMTKE